MRRTRRTGIFVAVVLILAAGTLVAVIRWLDRLPPSLFADWRPTTAGKLWTVAGDPHSPHEALVDPTGAFQPGRDRYSIHYYLYDRDAGKLLLGRPERLLLRGCLPAPVVQWENERVVVRMRTFAVVHKGRDTCFSEFVIRNRRNRPLRLTLFVAILPYQIDGAFYGGSSISYDDTRRLVLMNGRPFLRCERPAAFSAVWSDPRREGMLDATCYIQRGMLPPSGSVPAVPKGLTSAALAYSVDLKRGERQAFRFAAPLGNGHCAPPSALAAAGNDLLLSWEQELAGTKRARPDSRASAYLVPSLAYLIVLIDDGLPRPGATKYEGFWIRDFVYIADAFYAAGRADLVSPGLAQIKRMQLPSGGFRPTTNSATDDELDAPGQAIYALVGHYRRTLDKARLATDWSAILSACRYLQAKRRSNTSTDPTKRGILPASRSAEDIGPPNIQHYWDDFWAIRGLEDAAFAARELGHAEDAEWISREAGELRKAFWDSWRALSRKTGIDYIPNGPEDITSSAMARGTSCGVWPCAVLDPADPVVRRSFDVYWEKWIGPHHGGFLHKGSFWPYAGLDLAHCYLSLGQPGRARTILRWTLDHDPTRGFFSYPEGMNRKDLTLSVGDMPHGWFCASYILLIHRMQPK